MRLSDTLWGEDVPSDATLRRLTGMSERAATQKAKRPWYSKVLYGAVLVAVVWYLWKNIGEISRYEMEIQWQKLSLAFQRGLVA